MPKGAPGGLTTGCPSATGVADRAEIARAIGAGYDGNDEMAAGCATINAIGAWSLRRAAFTWVERKCSG